MSVVNIRKKVLNKRNIGDFKEWNSDPNTLYIGRDMSFYVPGATKSEWFNPYSSKKYGREECIKMYRKYIRQSDLYDQLEELDGKELGCWCKPESCHGDVLIKLLKVKVKEEKKKKEMKKEERRKKREEKKKERKKEKDKEEEDPIEV